MLLLCEQLAVGDRGLNGSHFLNEELWGFLKGGLDILILAVSLSKAEQTSEKSLGRLIEVLLNLIVKLPYLQKALSGKDQFWSDEHLEYNHSDAPSVPQVVTLLDACEDMLVAGAVGRIDAAWFPYIVEHSASISQVIKDNCFSLLVEEYC